MDSNVRPVDDSLVRELPQLQGLRIAPLRQPVPSRNLSVSSLLEPNDGGVREPNTGSRTNAFSGNVPASLPTLTEFLNAARTKKNDPSVDSLLSLEPPPKPILPAFVNLRALERSPYSFFDDDASHARKRRRLDVQTDSFGEHLQLPIPQAQKEQRPPPFGPLAILNGLNEPPPNAALLPPIESSSIHQLLNRPSRDDLNVESSIITSNADGRSVGRWEGKIEDILDSPLGDKTSRVHRYSQAERLYRKGRVGHDEGEFSESETDDHTQFGERHDELLRSEPRGRSRRNTRKWTEEETIDLLKGVGKCGIGNWKAILAQPELKFNKRTASNLKDRFRFCCPWAYRTNDPNEAMTQLHDTLAQAVRRLEAKRSEALAGKIRSLHDRLAHSGTDQSSLRASPAMSSNELSSGTTSGTEIDAEQSVRGMPREFVTARLNESKTPLESLGVPEPDLAATHRRRNRNPFTTAEDEALLKGYAVHGFQWTLIQQDKRLNLGHRKPTDLRDRFRNKFPDAYHHGGSVSGKALQATEPADGYSKLTALDRQKPLINASQRLTLSNGEVRNTSQLAVRTTDLGFSSLAPPQTLLPDVSTSFTLPLDDHPTGVIVDTPLEVNTLPPLVWDELPD